MNTAEKKFITTVKKYYRESGRHTLLWRKTRDPYKILVSEVMLQQTQVERVIPKYKTFLKLFSSIHVLAGASLGDVLRAWQGLGYNRRAKMLHLCAQNVVEEYKGKLPQTTHELKVLPGIGDYTASAVLAFAYNIPTLMIETNIRSVYIHHFFKGKEKVSDKKLWPLIEKTNDQKNPRQWYYALMDYGAYIKTTYGNPNKKSEQYKKQTSFHNSDRQIRGAILRFLSKQSLTRKSVLSKLKHFEDIRVDVQLAHLEKESLILRKKGVYTLP